jgi:hypothetical protein
MRTATSSSTRRMNRGDRGDVGIIRSPVRASIPPDRRMRTRRMIGVEETSASFEARSRASIIPNPVEDGCNLGRRSHFSMRKSLSHANRKLQLPQIRVCIVDATTLAPSFNRQPTCQAAGLDLRQLCLRSLCNPQSNAGRILAQTNRPCTRICH